MEHNEEALWELVSAVRGSPVSPQTPSSEAQELLLPHQQRPHFSKEGEEKTGLAPLSSRVTPEGPPWLQPQTSGTGRVCAQPHQAPPRVLWCPTQLILVTFWRRHPWRSLNATSLSTGSVAVCQKQSKLLQQALSQTKAAISLTKRG